MKYNVTVETLTPLHIGTGVELLKNFDYVSKPGDGRTYVLDQEAVFAAELDSQGAAARLDRPAGTLLSSEYWHEGSPFVRYSLRGSTSIERVHEQIKDAHGRCYLPGSSLKGALRTALLAYTIGSKAFVPDVNQLGRSKEWAALAWEHEVFGPDPNADILKALHVSDSEPRPLSPTALELLQAQVFTGGEPGSPVMVEAVQARMAFKTEIVIDELALKYGNDPRLNWNTRALWLASLIEIVQTVSRARIEAEWVTATDKGFVDTAGFYRQLTDVAEQFRGRNMALLQMGWGTGWTGMTVGPWLDEAAQNTVRQRYELGRPPTTRGPWQPDLSRPFPKSRRLRSITSGTTGPRPGRPLGWLSLIFEPVGAASPEWELLRQQALATFKPIAVREQRPRVDTAAATDRTEPQANAAEAPETRPPDAALKPDGPVAPRPHRPAEEVRRPLIASFSALPAIGDRFRGKVISAEPDGTLYAEIPGLSPDEVALAVVGYDDNPERRRFAEGATITCEALSIDPDPAQPGLSLVHCRRE